MSSVVLIVTTGSSAVELKYKKSQFKVNTD